jgi:hypothetical protein
VALDAQAGSAGANAYCTVTQATMLLHERLTTDAWYQESEDPLHSLTSQREAALMQATRVLDEQLMWIGMPTFTTQALGWPRTGALTPQGQTLDPLLIPVVIQRATAYYALALLEAQQAAAGGDAVESGGVKRRKIGDTEIEYFEGGSAAGQVAPVSGGMPPEVQQMLRPYGVMAGAVNLRLLRV